MTVDGPSEGNDRYVEVEREFVIHAIDLLADVSRGNTDLSEQAYEDASRSLICDIDGASWEDAGYRTEADSDE